MTPQQQIDSLLNVLNYNAKSFSEALGYERPQIIYDIIKGKTKSLSPVLIDKILSVFPNVNKLWLLTGEGNMLVESDGEIMSDSQKKDSSIYGSVPLLPVEATAGFAVGFSEGIELRGCRKIPSPVPGADFAIQISGDSMEPNYRNGSILFIKKINSKTFIPWGHEVVLDTDNGAVFKRIFPVKDSNEYIIGKSFNLDYPDMEIYTSGIFGIYKVVGSTFINSTL